jgi:nanoRNase/pAp phosphatase (c-di-AMP/oligoRNAs hydrolase)
MRLVTRSDFDGLVCAVLLKQVVDIDSIQFVHPKDLQDGVFEVTGADILANVPFVPGCGLWFDHHVTELDRVVGKLDFEGECRLAPSAARVVYDYYGGKERFPGLEELMEAVDKADSARFTREEILYPSGWPLLSFIMDARTGLGRFKDYRISNYQLMYDLIDACSHLGITEILDLPDVRERVNRYFEQDAIFRKMVLEHTRADGRVIVTDLRGVYPIYSGNRFLVYAMFPEQDQSIWVVDGLRGQNCVLACGRSIIRAGAQTNIGALMRKYGGGGHEAAGTCQVPYEKASEVLAEVVAAMDCPGQEKPAGRIAA